MPPPQIRPTPAPAPVPLPAPAPLAPSKSKSVAAASPAPSLAAREEDELRRALRASEEQARLDEIARLQQAVQDRDRALREANARADGAFVQVGQLSDQVAAISVENERLQDARDAAGHHSLC